MYHKSKMSFFSVHTEVILIPSSRDVHHQPVYPTPPYLLRKSHPNLHLMPDPCLLDVSGIIFAISSTDILMHLGREEVCKYVSLLVFMCYEITF